MSENLACDVDDLATQINRGDHVVPTRIYHYGRKSDLLQDAAAHTIPQNIWDQFIMAKSGSGRYRLKPFREGLYGTVGLDTNFFYDQNEYNWMIQIDLDSSCVSPEHVASFIDLPKNSNFQKWFEKVKPLDYSINDFKRICYEKDSTYPTYVRPVDGGGPEVPETDCEIILNKYLNDNHIQVVQDYLIEKSFYVRDRACIKAVRGSASELLQAFAENSYLWHSPCPLSSGKPDEFDHDELSKEYRRNLKTIPSLINAALADPTATLTAEDTELLKKNIQLIDESAWRSAEQDRSTSKILLEELDTRQRCQMVGKPDEFSNLVKFWEHLDENVLRQLKETCVIPAQSAQRDHH